MTDDLSKDSSRCLICDTKVGAARRNCVQIFDDEAVDTADGPLVRTISAILEKEVTRETVHSVLLCKKCYKLFAEFDELESRLKAIRREVYENYEKTMKKISPTPGQRDEYNDHDYVDHTDAHLIDALNIKYSEKELETFSQINNVDGGETITEYLVHDIDGTMDNVEYLEYGEESDDVVIKYETVGSDAAKADRTSENRTVIENNDTEDTSVIVKQEEFDDEPIVTRNGADYTCLLCPNDDDNNERIAGDAKFITTHIKAVHDSRLYICDVCGIVFRKRNELSLHMDDHVSKEDGDFQCEVCNRIFNNLRLFRIHKRIHYPQVKSWPCATCGKKYSSKNLLEEHINTHTGIRPYVCEHCGKDFASKYTYRAHVKTHEARPRPFECSQCNKSFLSQQNLNQHERTHNGIKEYVCHQCGKAFGSHHNLEVHNIVHTGYKPYVCRICNKAFARKAEIRDHERTHTGEKPYQCEFCGATFSQRSNLQSHKRATHYNDKRYKCEDCGKGFKRRRLLDYHTKAAHTGERPYKCETCTATFVYPEHFKKHMRIHTGEKPYLCEVCGKAFNSRDNRNAHRFIHSDKKPYECLVCGMGFMRKPLLYAHMQTRGHLNDIIVVNQPRLTTEDEEQAIDAPQGNVQYLMSGTTDQRLEEAELYVAELNEQIVVERERGIFPDEGITNESNDSQDIAVQQQAIEHERIDAAQITYENDYL